MTEIFIYSGFWYFLSILIRIEGELSPVDFPFNQRDESRKIENKRDGSKKANYQDIFFIIPGLGSKNTPFWMRS